MEQTGERREGAGGVPGVAVPGQRTGNGAGAVIVLPGKQRAVVPFAHHPVTQVVLQLHMGGGRRDFNQAAHRIIAVVQGVVRRGFTQQQAAGIVEEVAGVAFAITHADAQAVLVIAVVGLGAGHVALADDPPVGVQPPLPAAAVRGNNRCQLLAFPVVPVVPGAAFGVGARGQQVERAEALAPQRAVAVHVAQQVVVAVVLAPLFLVVRTHQLLRQRPTGPAITEPKAHAVRALPLHHPVLPVVT